MEYQIWHCGHWFDLWPWLTLLNSTRIDFFTHSVNTTWNLSAVVRVQQRGKAPESSCWIQLVAPTWQLHALRRQKHGQKILGWSQLRMLRWQQHLGRYVLPGYPSPPARTAQPRTTWHISQQLGKLLDLFFSEQPSQVLKLNASSTPL